MNVKTKLVIGASLLAVGWGIAQMSLAGDGNNRKCPTATEAMNFFRAYAKRMDTLLKDDDLGGAYIGMRIQTTFNLLWIQEYPLCGEPESRGIDSHQGKRFGG